jgi:hypothetical protein
MPFSIWLLKTAHEQLLKVEREHLKTAKRSIDRELPLSHDSSIAFTGSTIKHPFLCTGTPGVDGHMIDLDTWLDTNNPAEGAKWTLYDGFPQVSISSNTGWITGVGLYDPDGPGGIAAESRAYLLDASSVVPEPSGIALLALAVPALLHRRHQSRHDS